MLKLKNNRLKAFAFFIFLLSINFLCSFLHIRIDLTEEKRYSISASSKKLLRSLDDNLKIKILMKDDLPSEFKKLRNSIQDLLEELNDYASTPIEYTFINPLEFNTDKERFSFLDTVNALGIKPTNINKREKNNGKQEKQVVYPGAILEYKGRLIGIHFLSETLINTVYSLNNAEALLEYKLTSAIEKITTLKTPSIAYATGNGQPLGYEVIDLFNTLASQYRLDTVNLQTSPFISNQKYNLLLVVKPILTFTENEKFKIDQFVLNGGKAFFLIDNVYAEMQNLENKKSMVAQNINLQLDDLLFHYGARINYDLIQDLQCDRLPIQVGWNGDKPQFELMPWVYFPLLHPSDKHPITKNIDNILSSFVSSIELNQNDKIKKTPLLTSSLQSKKIGTPSLVSFDIFKEDLARKIFSPKEFTTAVLLEYQYNSLYSNRLTKEIISDFEVKSNQKILQNAKMPTKVIIASDGDLVINKVLQKEGPLKMGSNPYTKFEFGNKIFLQNCIEYLCSESGIIENRNKNFTLRLLNKKKIEEEKKYWQAINLIVPLLIAIFMHGLYSIWRWRKYKQL